MVDELHYYRMREKLLTRENKHVQEELEKARRDFDNLKSAFEEMFVGPGILHKERKRLFDKIVKECQE
jgi:hypothetical protein